MFSARVIASVKNPKNVLAVSNSPIGYRAVRKFAHYTGCDYITGGWNPGTLSNRRRSTFRAPRILLVANPDRDDIAVREAACANIACISLCNTDCALEYIDIGIPCNTNSNKTVGLVYWLLAREVLCLRGHISRKLPWHVDIKSFIHNDPS